MLNFDTVCTMEKIGREISFCKLFLNQDQLNVYEKKFDFINTIPYLEHIQQGQNEINHRIRTIGNNNINLKNDLENCFTV